MRTESRDTSPIRRESFLSQIRDDWNSFSPEEKSNARLLGVTVLSLVAGSASIAAYYEHRQDVFEASEQVAAAQRAEYMAFISSIEEAATNLDSQVDATVLIPDFTVNQDDNLSSIIYNILESSESYEDILRNADLDHEAEETLRLSAQYQGTVQPDDVFNVVELTLPGGDRVAVVRKVE